MPQHPQEVFLHCCNVSPVLNDANYAQIRPDENLKTQRRANVYDVVKLHFSVTNELSANFHNESGQCS